MIECEECKTLISEDAPVWEMKQYTEGELQGELELCSPCGEELQDAWDDDRLSMSVTTGNVVNEIDEVHFLMDGGRI